MTSQELKSLARIADALEKAVQKQEAHYRIATQFNMHDTIALGRLIPAPVKLVVLQSVAELRDIVGDQTDIPVLTREQVTSYAQLLQKDKSS